MSQNTIENKLQAPFAPDDIEWKPQMSGTSGNGKAYVLAVPYITNRAIQKRLDEVFGVFGWENEYRPAQHEKGFLCGITVHQDGKSITRWDGAENTHIEPLKGGLSNSMKRAAVQFGIGRYLYSLPEFWAKCVPCGNNRSLDGYDNVIYNKGDKPNIAWCNPALPDWALPVFDFDPYVEAIQLADSPSALKEAFKNAWRVAEVNQNTGMQQTFKATYDERKNVFDVEAAKSTQADIERVSAWIELRKEELALIPNAEAVSTVYRNYTAQLIEMCTGTFVDNNEMQQRLDAIHEARLSELKQGANHA